VATIDELIASIEVELEAAHKRRNKAIAETKAILSIASQEGRANLTAEEDERIAQLAVARDGAKSDADGIKGKLANANKVKAEELENQRATDEVLPTGAKLASRAHDHVARVGRESRTYRPDTDPTGTGFIRDITNQFLFGDVQSSSRLAYHMQEERVERQGQLHERAVGTGAFAGLTVPQYLTDLYAPNAAALRPFADVCNRHALPGDGMSVNISKITTATGVALQSSENSAVQETNIDDTLLTINVQTIAGQQTLSRQAIERGTGVESVVMDDLFRRYSTTLDSTLLNQATNGLTNVATNTAYTDASPTGPELYPKILGAQAGVDTALMGFGSPDVVVMHSRRWAWLQSQLTTSYPMISQPNIAPQVMGTNLHTKYGSGARGLLPNGLVVIVDNNISTTLGGGTEDEIYVVPTSECHLWEMPDAPVFIRAEQAAAASLGVLLVLYGYMAYSFARFSGGVAKVSGTGLIAPSF
jgi:HK97 family phage major capsid protein